MKSNFFERITPGILVGACVLVLTFTYFGFSSPYSQYLLMTHLVAYPGDFANDPVLSGSVYLKASIYYWIIGILDLPITNDILGMALHFILNGAILYLLFYVAKTEFACKTTSLSLIVVLSLCFMTSSIVLGSLSSAITIKTPTPTGLAHIAGMSALLFAFRKKIGIAVLFATLSIALTPKGTLLIVPALFLYCLIDKEISRRTILWFAIPFGYIIWRLAESPVAVMSAAETTEMVDMIMRREDEDGQFIAQPLLASIYLAATILTFPLLAQTTANRAARKLGYALAFVTGGAVLFNIAYSYLFHYFPVPLLVMISIPQATKFFVFVYLLFAVSWIVQTEIFYWHEKVALVFALVLLKPLPVQSFIVLFLITISVFVPRLVTCPLRLRSIKDLLVTLNTRIERRIPLPFALGALLCLFLIVRIGDSYVSPKSIDARAFQNIGSWSAGVWADEDAWNSWKTLTASGDFPLLAIYEQKPPNVPPQFGTHPAAYVISRKSPFATLPAHAYLDIRLWRESQKRYEIRRQLIDRINSGQPITDDFLGAVTIRKENVDIEINDTLFGFLSKRKARLLVPVKIDQLFPRSLQRKAVGNSAVLITF